MTGYKYKLEHKSSKYEINKNKNRAQQTGVHVTDTERELY